MIAKKGEGSTSPIRGAREMNFRCRDLNAGRRKLHVRQRGKGGGRPREKKGTGGQEVIAQRSMTGKSCEKEGGDAGSKCVT